MALPQTDPPVPWTARALILTLCAVAVIWTIGQGRYVVTDTVVPWDSKTQFYPFLRFVAAALGQGDWPTWNPYQYGGYPATADPQSLVFQPIFLLFALIDPTPSLRTFDIIVGIHLLIGAGALVVMVGRWRWHPLAAVLVACIYLFGAAVASRANHTGILVTMGLFPVAFLLLQILLDRRSWAAAFGFALVGAAMTIGRDQVAFLSALFLIVYAAQDLTRRVMNGRPIGRRILLLTLAGLGIVALLAVPILLTLEMAQLSNRPMFEFHQAAAGSVYPINLITLFAPNTFGSLDGYFGYFGPDVMTRPWVDTTDRTINYLFLGTAPAVLLVWHGLAGGRLWTPGPMRVVTIALGVFLLYAFGRYGGLFAVMFEYFPGIAQYRRPADATFLVTLFAALACGGLLNRYIDEGLPKARLVALVAVGIGVLALFVWAVQFASIKGQSRAAAGEIALACVLIGAIIAAFVLAPLRQHRLLVASVLVGLTGFELIGRNIASSLNAEPRSNYAVMEAPTGEARAALAALEADLAPRRANGERPRVEILGLGGPWQNLAMVRGLEATNGYNPLRLMDYELLVEAGQNSHETWLRSFPRSFAGYGSDLARLLGLDYIVTDRAPLSTMPQGAPQPASRLIFDGPTIKVHRLDQALPRVMLASLVTSFDRAQVLDERRLPGPLVDGNVWIEAGVRLRGRYDQVPPPPGPRTARIVRYDTDRIEIDVEAAGPAVLVLHDLWFPGWTATVDGKATPVFRANVMFRGIEVPAGRSRVRFDYRPLTMENLQSALRAVRQPWPVPPTLDSLLKPPQGFPSKPDS